MQMSKYNPNINHRRSIRLKGYDYSQAGAYSITICVQNRQCLFGRIIDGEMVLNDFGKIAYDEWVKLSERYPNTFFDIFQIMPNHIHGIIDLDYVGATLAVAQNWAGASPAPTIGTIVGVYKSLVANKCLEVCKSQNVFMGKLWQRNYWEHIIRNDNAYQYIADYIMNNPAQWESDKFYVES